MGFEEVNDEEYVEDHGVYTTKVDKKNSANAGCNEMKVKRG